MERQITAAMAKSIWLTQKLRKNVQEKIFPNCSLSQMRDCLEEIGIDRHFPIECFSVEFAIVTPEGILMNRKADDNNLLSLYRSFLKDGESFTQGIIRGIYEETKLSVDFDDLQFIEFKPGNLYQDRNLDKYLLNSYRFILELDHVPYKIPGKKCLISSQTLDNDIHKVVPYQQEFLLYLANRYCL